MEHTNDAKFIAAQLNAIRQAERQQKAIGLSINDPRFQQALNNQLNQIGRTYDIPVDSPLRIEY